MDPQQPPSNPQPQADPLPAASQQPVQPAQTPKAKSKLPIVIIVVVVVLVLLGYLVPLLLGGVGLLMLKGQFGPNFQYSSSNNKPTTPFIPAQPQVTVTLPSDFPTDVPIYPQAKLTSVTSIGQEKGFFNVTADLDSSKLEDATNFYKTELPKNGWKQYTSGSDTQGSSLIYTKDDGKLKKSVSIRVESYQNKGTLQISIASGLDSVPK